MARALSRGRGCKTSSARHSQVGASKAISDCRYIAMLLNRERRAAEQPSSHQRIHRIKGNNAMLLDKRTTVLKITHHRCFSSELSSRRFNPNPKKPNSSRNLPNHSRSALYYAGTEKAVPAVRLSIGSVFGHLLLQDSQIGDNRRRFILKNVRRVLAAIFDCEVRTQASLV